jgi:glycosyltransferase involved in cell wall biosynthesis
VAVQPLSRVLPELSLVIVVGDRRERVAGALASARAQGLGDRLEIVLVDCGRRDLPPVAGGEGLVVRTVAIGPGGTYGDARGAGARAASAPIVAFLEEHARVLPGWGEATIAAYRGPWAGVGGEAVNANPGVGRSAITFAMNYGLYAGPLRAGEAEHIPGHNSSYARAVLLGYDAELDRLLLADSVLQERLRRDGHRLCLAPGARFAHLNETTLAVAAHGLFVHHRMWGAVRAADQRWSLVRRLAYVLGTPLVPLYYLFRRWRRGGWRHGPGRVLLRHAPWVAAAQLAGAAGQALGVAFGLGESARRFAVYETTAPRPESATAASERPADASAASGPA